LVILNTGSKAAINVSFMTVVGALYARKAQLATDDPSLSLSEGLLVIAPVLVPLLFADPTLKEVGETFLSSDHKIWKTDFPGYDATHTEQVRKDLRQCFDILQSSTSTSANVDRATVALKKQFSLIKSRFSSMYVFACVCVWVCVCERESMYLMLRFC
jgi:hypothetical protein